MSTQSKADFPDYETGAARDEHAGQTEQIVNSHLAAIAIEDDCRASEADQPAEDDSQARREHRRRNIRLRWMLQEFDAYGEPYGWQPGVFDLTTATGRSRLHGDVKIHSQPLHPVCVKFDLASGTIKKRPLPGFQTPLTFAPHAMHPHSVLWSVESRDPETGGGDTLATFATFDDAAKWFKSWKSKRMTYSGEIVSIVPPGEVYQDTLPVWPDRWLVGEVDIETCETFALAACRRRKDAVACVHELIRQNYRPIVVAPWTPCPFDEAAKETASVKCKVAQ